MSLIQKRTAGTADKQSDLDLFRGRIALDRHALDLAAEEQPELFLSVAEHHVLAQSRHDQARDGLLREDAKLGREARAQMEKEGTKPTEGKVADVVLGMKEHIDAADKVARLKIEVDEWGALRSALEHRKSMIRELATLYASGYYTAGTASGVHSKVRDADAEAGRKRLAEARARRDG